MSDQLSSSKAFSWKLFGIKELSDFVIEFEPTALLVVFWHSFLDVTIIMTCISSPTVNKHTSEFIFVIGIGVGVLFFDGAPLFRCEAFFCPRLEVEKLGEFNFVMNFLFSECGVVEFESFEMNDYCV